MDKRNLERVKVFLYFPPDKVDKPITYRLAKDFDLVFNILHAEIHSDKEGKTMIELEGTEENIQRGLDYIKQQGVEYRIFDKNIIWNEEKCVHCGACTAVCPSRALVMDKKDWRLSFDQDKCLICGLCVKACPVNAMDISVFV